MRLLFWVAAFGVGYVYIGYPMLLVAWAAVRPRKIRRSPACWTEPPRISIVIAARNEAARLPARIDNLMALHYPADRREIIVVSDGSTDDTLGVLQRLNGTVQAVAAPPLGKAAALNLGCSHAKGDVLVFADARQMFAPDALLALVAPLSDPAVGGVTGEFDPGLRSRERRGPADRRTPLAGRDRPPVARRRSGTPPGCRPPGRSDVEHRRGRRPVLAVRETAPASRKSRRLDARSDGRHLRPPPIAVPPAARGHHSRRCSHADEGCPLGPSGRVQRTGNRVRSGRARCARRAPAEIRTLAGNVQILWQEPRLLIPVVNPVWLQYVSHKVGRLLVPYGLLALLAANVALAAGSAFYTLTLAVQCALYLLAAYGAWLDRQRVPTGPAESAGWIAVDRLARVALTFLVLNYSAVAGVAAALTRRSVWR